MKIAFLDRDGVINENTGYLYQIEHFQFKEGCIEALKTLQELGYEIAIITNQSGIARGYYSEKDYQHLTDWMLAELNRNGISILQVKYCPHLPSGVVPEYTKVCNCRKPKPGMINEIIAEQGGEVDRAASILVGDNLSDIDAGRAAGLNQLFLVGEQSHSESAVALNCQTFNSLYSVTQFLTHSIT